MKKKSIILSVATCCFAAFTACDMDLASETSIPTNQSVQSVQDCGKYSNLFHAEWRGYVQNSYMYCRFCKKHTVHRETK